MHRAGTNWLYEKICERELLSQALDKAARGKKHRNSVKRVLANREKHLDILQRILTEQTYKPLGYSKKVIQDRGSGKTREIAIPKFFPDQVVQWALILVIKPILMRGMYYFSCASIDGRGASHGIRYLKRWLRRDPVHTKYCLQIDVKKFYPSINQEVLLEKFRRKIKCQKTLNLIEKIVHSIDSGLPIGNVTSQWFANFYLQDFDHFAKEQLHLPYYIRYMDDMVFLSSNKRKLAKAQAEIEKFLRRDKLSIKPNWKLFEVANKLKEQPIDFLGYRFYHTFIRLRSRTFLRLRRRLKKVAKKQNLPVLDAQAVMSYLARAKITSGDKLYENVIASKVSIAWCRKRISLFDKKAAQTKKLALASSF